MRNVAFFLLELKVHDPPMVVFFFCLCWVFLYPRLSSQLQIQCLEIGEGLF